MAFVYDDNEAPKPCTRLPKNIHLSHGSNDMVEFTRSTCTWFDQCAFSQGKAGNLDIVRGSNHITVWARRLLVVVALNVGRSTLAAYRGLAARLGPRLAQKL